MNLKDKLYFQVFGETFIDDDMFIAFAFSTASICNALARVGWGILADRTNFQVYLSTYIIYFIDNSKVLSLFGDL